MKRESSYVRMLVYVDDILMIYNDFDLLRELKRSLTQHYKMTDLGVAEYFLGVRIMQSPKSLTIS